jgi:hypothetical protein
MYIHFITSCHQNPVRRTLIILGVISRSVQFYYHKRRKLTSAEYYDEIPRLPLAPMQSELNGPQREEKYHGYNHDCDDRWDELSVTFQQAGMIVVLGDQKAKVER